jgi:hypothetical protein
MLRFCGRRFGWSNFSNRRCFFGYWCSFCGRPCFFNYWRSLFGY